MWFESQFGFNVIKNKKKSQHFRNSGLYIYKLFNLKINILIELLCCHAMLLFENTEAALLNSEI